jgi:hypothetical protein
MRRVTAVLAAMALASVGLVVVVAQPARAAITCSPVWYTIEVGNNPGHFLRPSWGGPNALIYPNGTAAEPWNNLFQLCHGPLHNRGEYGLRANLGGHYMKFNRLTLDVIMGSDTIEDNFNLFRIRDFDGNFQTLWSTYQGRYLGPVSPANELGIQPAALNGTMLYRVRSVQAPPQKPDMLCDPHGTLPGPCPWP